MILAIDVHYRENLAKTVSIAFEDWQDDQPSNIQVLDLPIADDYQPGEFYKRELPCIVEVLTLFDLSFCETIIIDGYVTLSNDGKRGLGAYVFDHLDGKIPVVGVAKKRFHNNDLYVAEVLRGSSANPLFISVAGMALNDAAEKVKTMHGEFRMPTLLKILDQKTKEN
ncbi:MAG: endonuclease V [Bacteroidota bacterium]